jgi:hypothetical protein
MALKTSGLNALELVRFFGAIPSYKKFVIPNPESNLANESPQSVVLSAFLEANLSHYI